MRCDVPASLVGDNKGEAEFTHVIHFIKYCLNADAFR